MLKGYIPFTLSSEKPAEKQVSLFLSHPELPLADNVSENVSEKTMSNITFHVELERHVKKDGTSSLQIRITQNRRLKRVKVGASIPPDHWNSEKSEVRKLNPQYRTINALIKSKLIELERMYLERPLSNKETTAEGLIRKFKKEVVGESFLEFARRRIRKMVSPWTHRAQESVVKKIEEYVGTKGLYFTEVTYEFLINYERYLKKRKMA